MGEELGEKPICGLWLWCVANKLTFSHTSIAEKDRVLEEFVKSPLFAAANER